MARKTSLLNKVTDKLAFGGTIDKYMAKQKKTKKSQSNRLLEWKTGHATEKTKSRIKKATSKRK